MLRLLQQLGVIDQVEAQRLATAQVVVQAGDLDQAPAPVLLAVAIGRRGVAQARRELAGVVLGQVGITAQLAHVTQLARLMANLSDKRRLPPRRDDAEPPHGGIEDGCKNAGFRAGVREDLLQLLYG
ncbi:hypothetical protein D3C81_1785610 [compost metagenome]